MFGLYLLMNVHNVFSSSDPEAETRFNSIEKLIIIFEIGGFPE